MRPMRRLPAMRCPRRAETQSTRPAPTLRPIWPTTRNQSTYQFIRRLAVRYGDDQIAQVLNRLGHRTGKGKRFNEQRVKAARRNHAIAGHKRATPDPEILGLGAAARYAQVSEWTIQRLVGSGLLPMQQVVTYAPWEIQRRDLDAEPVRSILERLRRTGKLVLEGVRVKKEPTLFPENKGLDKAR
jgi:hypothetical protein